jgi:hypothetical protein
MASKVSVTTDWIPGEARIISARASLREIRYPCRKGNSNSSVRMSHSVSRPTAVSSRIRREARNRDTRFAGAGKAIGERRGAFRQACAIVTDLVLHCLTDAKVWNGTSDSMRSS